MSSLIIPLRGHTTIARPVARRAVGELLWLPWGYLGMITLAELLTALVSAELGLSIHALLLIGLTIRGAVWQSGVERRLALTLTLVPLTRLISLAMPLTNIPQLAWYPIVATPLLIAALIITRQLRVPRADLGLRPSNLLLQLMVMGCGMAIGVGEYIILRPAPLITTFSWSSFALAALVLTVSTGFAEELIFRGLLQSAAVPALGRWALVYVSLLFTTMHIGHLSLLNVAFVFGVGLSFAHIVRWGGSILGVSLAHSLTNITLFLIMPYLVEHPTAAAAAIAPWVAWGGIVITIVAVEILALHAAMTQPTAQPEPLTTTNIRALRRSAGISYVELARRTGLPVRLIVEIEYELCPLQPEHLCRIADALGVTRQSLISASASQAGRHHQGRRKFSSSC
jgi:membrane protease YdiL (CAAX protease family)